MAQARSRSRTVRATVVAAVNDLDLHATAQPFGAIAVVLAGQLDHAAKASRGEVAADRARRAADVVRISRELRNLLAYLQGQRVPDLADPVGGGGDGDDDDSARAARPAGPGPVGVDAELAELVGAGPSMGDPA